MGKLPFPIGALNKKVTETYSTVAMIPAPAGMFGRSTTMVDGGEAVYEDPAVCLLLQERRSLLLTWRLEDDEQTYLRTEKEDPPYETRVVPGFLYEDGTVAEDTGYEIIYKVRD